VFMKLYIFTFGIGPDLSDKYQGIYATDEVTATKLMFKHHGKKWMTCYEEEKFSQLQRRGILSALRPLEPIKQEAI